MNGRALLASALVGLVAPSALADTVIELGGGWEAIVIDEDFIDLAVDFVSIEDDILVIEKFANFLNIDELTGQPDPVRILFNQIAPDDQTVSRIVIADEVVSNNTGFDWIGFEMHLLSSTAHWDPDASMDFTFDPFTSMSFNGDNSVVSFGGGTIFDGDLWTPGVDAGELVINVDLSNEQPVEFVLKEIAIIPAPGAAALLGLAALATRRRRRC